jgi:hypothetical protein
MPNRAEDAFVVEGLRRYASALDTIQAFQRALGDRLREVAKAYASSIFSTTNGAVDSGASQGRWGRAVWATQPGIVRPKGEAWLELGLWWRNDEVAYYCGFVDANNKALDFTYTRNHPRIEPCKWSRKARLFMLVSSEPEVSLDDEFKIILDELTGSFH